MKREGASTLARWMRPAWLTVALALGASLAACDSGDEGQARPEPVDSARQASQDGSTSAPMFGRPVLIRTRVVDAVEHVGVVLGSSVVGETAFCRGGRSSGSSEGAAITTTFDCPTGSLTIRYAPTQRSRVQGAVWDAVGGTGDFANLRGGGSMVAVFDKDDPDSGRETFTGTLGE